MRSLIFFIWGLLVGCTNQSEIKNLNLPEMALSPQSLGESLNLAQQISITSHFKNNDSPQFNHANNTVETLVNIDRDSIKIAGFYMQQRVFKLEWDGSNLKSERQKMFPSLVDDKKILRDLQLIYWPKDSISQALPEGWSIKDESDQRSLSYRGENEIIIQYHAFPAWNSIVEFQNFMEKYSLKINSSAQAEP